MAKTPDSPQNRSTSAAGSNPLRPEHFALKGGLIPMTLLEVRSENVQSFTQEVLTKTAAAPEFFLGSPVVLSFEQLPEASETFMRTALQGAEKAGFKIVGLKGEGEPLAALARKRGIAVFPASAKTAAKPGRDCSPVAESAAKQSAQPVTAHDRSPSAETKTRTIVTPIRSGQQVFAEGDLLILASVSPGAELLATGNIHVYGALRGRALAGVQGDTSARIFCLSQEAELVSIAGHFMIDQSLRDACWKSPAQIVFDGEALRVSALLDAVK
jgi:septum site-determining protein MinC